MRTLVTAYSRLLNGLGRITGGKRLRQTGIQRRQPMKKSTKAVLLSGLVFPGLGHLYLKRWLEGILLTGVAAYAAYLIVSITLGIALDIVQKDREWRGSIGYRLHNQSCDATVKWQRTGDRYGLDSVACVLVDRDCRRLLARACPGQAITGCGKPKRGQIPVRRLYPKFSAKVLFGLVYRHSHYFF